MPIRMKRKNTKDTINTSYTTIPLTFIPNKGQVDTNAKFYVTGTSYGFYFTPEEAVLTFTSKNSSDTSGKFNGVALSLQFLGANSEVQIEGLCKASGKVNYFNGEDQSKWITNLSTFEKIVYKELWPGIDLVFYGMDNALKYEFILQPDASLEDINLAYKGSNGISLDDEGNLLIHNDLGILIDERPISYQEIDGEKIMIDSHFSIKEQENEESSYGFEIPVEYNLKYPLIIDPGLVYSTFLGALLDDVGTNEANKVGITVDKSGNVYVAGSTISPNFPVTLGAFQENFPSIGNEITSAFILKLNPEGSNLIYSTFLGGNNNDEARGIAIDNMGNTYVTGETASPDFPVTLGAFQEKFPSTNGDSSSAFVAKLNFDGSQLVYSTFLGGSNDDEGTDIDIDKMGNAYVTGETASSDFPVTLGAFQQVFQGSDDNVFVTKLNPDGTDLVYSTFLGGSNDDEGLGIAVDYMGNAYVSGETTSPDFPVTSGAFQEVFTGDSDTAFVTKLNPDGSALVYSTFLGGSGDDEANRIAIDKMGNAYAAGETTSRDFPVTSGAFKQEFLADDDAAFITKISPDGSTLIYSTFLNGTGGDNECQGIAVDNMGNAYVAGFTNSSDFPVTLGAFQEVFKGETDEDCCRDAFVAKLSPDGSILLYSTFLGGSGDDIARDIAIDCEGNAYVIGFTTSSNFPITLGAFQENFQGDPDDDEVFDAFVAKIDPTPLL